MRSVALFSRLMILDYILCSARFIYTSAKQNVIFSCENEQTHEPRDTQNKSNLRKIFR